MKEMEPAIRDIIAESICADEKTIRGWVQAAFSPDMDSEAMLAQSGYQHAADLLHDAQCEFRRAAACHMLSLRQRSTR